MNKETIPSSPIILSRPIYRDNRIYKREWSRKNKGDADKYFCVCMTENIPMKYYLIPKLNFRNGISMGFNSKKFNQFLINEL